ncbi:MAG: hypothetical protein IM651_09285 [Phenylobacterium sp.]|nr:hypothetical protein [Phenylobacterium sp.]
MPIFGKIGQALGQMGRFYTSPEGIQNLQATFQDMANPGGGAFQSLQERRMRLAQQQQQQQAIQGLLAQMQPDTQTPQVNELIGEANLAGRGRFDPMDQMQAKAPAFDFTSPQGQAALMKALGAGVSLDGISGLRDFLSPKRNTTKLGENDTLVDDDGNVVGQGRMKPMEPQKRSTDSVVADIAYRYSRGEQISPREMELYRLWSAQERKQGQWAPNVSGAPGPRPTGRRVTF